MCSFDVRSLLEPSEQKEPNHRAKPRSRIKEPQRLTDIVTEADPLEMREVKARTQRTGE